MLNIHYVKEISPLDASGLGCIGVLKEYLSTDVLDMEMLSMQMIRSYSKLDQFDNEMRGSQCLWEQNGLTFLPCLSI